MTTLFFTKTESFQLILKESVHQSQCLQLLNLTIWSVQDTFLNLFYRSLHWLCLQFWCTKMSLHWLWLYFNQLFLCKLPPYLDCRPLPECCLLFFFPDKYLTYFLSNFTTSEISKLFVMTTRLRGSKGFTTWDSVFWSSVVFLNVS